MQALLKFHNFFVAGYSLLVVGCPLLVVRPLTSIDLPFTSISSIKYQDFSQELFAFSS